MAVAMADPSLMTIAATATAQVAASTMVTAVLTPILTLYIAKRNKKNNSGKIAEAGSLT
jgi:2-keto-3-deoxygluconate permease